MEESFEPQFMGEHVAVFDTTTGLICDICGKPATTQTWSDRKLKATRCDEHPYTEYPSLAQTLDSAYNYKCPDCGGEFNQPAQGLPSGTYVRYFCPFCNREMEGL